MGSRRIAEMVLRWLTLLSLSWWKALGMDRSGTTPEREVTGRAPERLVANDQLSWPSVHHTHAWGEETRVPQGPVSLDQELAIFFTLRGNFLFFEAVICASRRMWITTARCPSQSASVSAYSPCSLQCCGKVSGHSLLQLQSIWKCSPQTDFRMMNCKPKAGSFLKYKYWICPNHLPL